MAQMHLKRRDGCEDDDQDEENAAEGEDLMPDAVGADSDREKGLFVGQGSYPHVQ